MSDELTLRPGELVDIEIRGARVVDTATGMLTVVYVHQDGELVPTTTAEDGAS